MKYEAALQGGLSLLQRFTTGYPYTRNVTYDISSVYFTGFFAVLVNMYLDKKNGRMLLIEKEVLLSNQN